MLLKCPVCGSVANDSFYNHKTVVFMKKHSRGGSFRPVSTQLKSEDHSYVCPKCEGISTGSELEVVK